MNDDNELHVVPVGDLVEHHTPQCWCDYDIEEVAQPNGVGTLVVHRAIDGRE